MDCWVCPLTDGALEEYRKDSVVVKDTRLI